MQTPGKHRNSCFDHHSLVNFIDVPYSCFVCCSDAGAVTPPAAKAMTPPAKLQAGSINGNSSGGGSTGAPQHQAPRTPPAGTGAGLLSSKQDRGEKERIAKLPEPGVRGFTLGRGQHLASPVPGSNAAAAPGSNAAAVAAGSSAAGSNAAVLPARGPVARELSLGGDLQLPPAATAATPFAAVGGDGGAAAAAAVMQPPPQQQQQDGPVSGSAPLPPSDSGQLLMRMLQRG